MLFEDYLESLDEQGNAPRAKKTAGSKLTGIDKVLYTKLTRYIAQVAAGDRASTVFDIPVEELGLDQLTWTASELGVEAIIVDDDFSYDAVAAVYAKCTYHSSQIIQALLADNPYELYWYEKTKNTLTEGYSITADYDRDKDEYVIGIEGSISMSFPIADEYSAGVYTFDTEIGKSVQTIVENAMVIVAKYAAATQLFLAGYTSKESDIQYTFKCNSGNIVYAYNEKTTNLFSEELEINNNNYSSHTFGDWTVIKAATCIEEGSREKTCSDCGIKVTETIPALGHTWSETYTADKEIICTICGAIKTEEIPAPGCHIEAAPVTENEIPATYLADGSYDSVVYCSSCGIELSRETIIVPKLTSKDQVISAAKTSYNFIFSSSKVQSQAVPVTGAMGKLSYTSSKSSYVYGKDGKIYVARSAPSGTYTISIRAAGTEDGEYNASNAITVKVKIAKAANTIKVTPDAKKLKAAKVKKKAQSFQIKVSQSQGKISYKSSSSKVKVTSGGKVTVKKGTKKGKYRITVTAAGNGNYNKGVKTVVITVK